MTMHAVRRRIAIGWLPVLLAFSLGGAIAGCSSAAPAGTATTAQAGSSGASSGGVTTGHTMGHAMPAAGELDAMLAARPAYVHAADARTQEAYAFAIAHPDVTDWMPCYCGCVAMDHRNNTDCYLQPRAAGELAAFDEHASYCVICVDISLRAKSMLADGRTLIQIRAAVDSEFGSTAPGTNTPLPPG